MASRGKRTVKSRGESGRVVVSVNLPIGLYRELLELLKTRNYVHLSDLIRAALRFYIDYHKRYYGRPPGLVLA